MLTSLVYFLNVVSSSKKFFVHFTQNKILTSSFSAKKKKDEYLSSFLLATRLTSWIWVLSIYRADFATGRVRKMTIFRYLYCGHRRKVLDQPMDPQKPTTLDSSVLTFNRKLFVAPRTRCALVDLKKGKSVFDTGFVLFP